MQDRFKFRYFYNGKIYDVFAVDFMNKTAQLVSLDRKETLFKGIDIAKLIQCTGLKDKNGTLIYEGDIVRTDDNIILLTKIHQKIDMDYGRVEFIRDFGFKFPLTYIPSIANEVEVIGNIYENPELLDKDEVRRILE